MKKRNWTSERFSGEAPLEAVGPLANLLDIMLVFACGLIAALLAYSGEVLPSEGSEPGARVPRVERQENIDDVPEGLRQQGEGYVPVGQVYRDPESGDMYLIEEDQTEETGN